MLVWDKRWKSHEARVGDLEDSQRLVFALRCIDQVIGILGDEFVSSIPIGLRKEIEEPLGQFWSDNEAQSMDSLESQIEESNVPGVYDLVMSVVTLRDCTAEDCDSEMVLECLSYCYQAVLDVEILSRLERNMTESEVNVLEEKNLQCVHVIDGQLEILDQVESGSEAKRFRSLV